MHYTAVVATKRPEDLEDALARFSEDLEVDPHWEPLYDEGWFRKYTNEKHPEIPVDAPAERMLPYVVEYEGCPGVIRDGKIGYMATSNPDGHWDYWRIGGRWPGMLATRGDGKVGEPAWEWTDRSLGGDPEGWPGSLPGACDQCLKRDVDFDQMGANKITRCRRTWSQAQTMKEEMIQKFGPDAQNRSNLRFLTGVEWDESEEEYVARVMADTGGFQTHTVVTIDGEWHEKQWDTGLVFRDYGEERRDEYNRLQREAWARFDAEWAVEFKRLWDEIPDDAWVTIIDYHS